MKTNIGNRSLKCNKEIMKAKFLFILIILLGFYLRIFKLQEFPATLYGDEQAFAWNAYNILKLGQDEFGTPFPLQFKSFGDYKAPIPVYLLVPFIKFLGLNSFAIRLPIVLASILTILAAYLLSRLFLNQKTSLLVAFLLTISPWHIHLSRGFFESTLSLLFFILGIYFIFRSKEKIGLMILGMIFFGLSIYSYFTPRILIPFILIFILIYQFVLLNSKRIIFVRNYFVGFIVLLIISIPLINLTFLGGGSRMSYLLKDTDKKIVDTVNTERFASNLSIPWRAKLHNKATVWARVITDNYLEHLSANFWYIYGDNSLRYFTGNMGMFYLLEFPFLIIGLYILWKEKREVAILFLCWILLAPIPASIVGRPFAVRSLALLPAPFIFVGYGIYKSLFYFRKSILKWGIILALVFGFTISLGNLLIRYYFEYPVYAATWWGWENKAALDYAKLREKKFDQIFISDFYSGAPLAFAVYNAYDPLKYRYSINHPVIMADGRRLIKLGKFYFGSLDINAQRLRQNIIPPRSLYIARPEEADSSEEIHAPDDGRVIFKIYSIY